MPICARFCVPLSEYSTVKTMKTYPLLLLSLVACCSCNGLAQRTSRAIAERNAVEATVVQPKRYTYRVRNVYPHSTTSYTQGLQFIDGELWEGTGQHGASVLQRIDLATGRTDVKVRLPHEEFGEGITLLDSLVFQLTWTSNTVHVYDRRTLRELRTHRYPGEGWGLTSDGRMLYMSDGTARIHQIDPDGFRRLRSITVTCAGVLVPYLNELEWIDGRIWANVYTSDTVMIIDPATGTVEGVADISGLLPAEEITPATDVLNGIACDAATGRIFVTGKNWSKLFEIELIEL